MIENLDAIISTTTAAVVVGGAIFKCLHVAKEWDRYPVFRLGHYSRMRGPGLFFTIPFIESVDDPIDLRTQTTKLTAEDTLTKDGTPMDIEAVVLWNVDDPKRAKLEVERYKKSIRLVSQASLRQSISSMDFDKVVADREHMDEKIKEILDPKVADWGITIESVQILDIRLPEGLQEAMSRQAQASREREARVTLSLAEKQIAENAIEAAQMYATHPKAFELRQLNVMAEMVRDGGSSTIFIPVGTPVAATAGLQLMPPVAKAAA